MTIQEYTLIDVQDTLNDISNISLFLCSGACPEQLTDPLKEHLQREIELAQIMLNQVVLLPQIKSEQNAA